MSGSLQDSPTGWSSLDMVAIQWDTFDRSWQTGWKAKLGEVCGGFAGNVFVEAVAISSDQLPAAAVSAAAAPV